MMADGRQRRNTSPLHVPKIYCEFRFKTFEEGL